MIRRVIRLALLAGDDALRPGAGEAGRRMDVFLVVAGGLLWQAALTVLERGPVVRELQMAAVLDPGQRRPHVDVATKDFVAELVVDRLVANERFGGGRGGGCRRSGWRGIVRCFARLGDGRLLLLS